MLHVYYPLSLYSNSDINLNSDFTYNYYHISLIVNIFLLAEQYIPNVIVKLALANILIIKKASAPALALSYFKSSPFEAITF